MMDPYFRRSVIALCEHNDEGSLGLIINKRLDVTINDLIEDFPEFNAHVYYGGPVQTDTIQYLHRVGGMLEGSRRISQDVYWGGEYKSLLFLIKNKVIRPDDVRFFVGYAGWAAGQLDEEIKAGSWMIGDMSANYLFKFAPESVWEKAVGHKGPNYQVIASIPNEMMLN